ncbi:TetR/AcrR family transcriptional regulator [Streptosporangium carneum]|uniref:TetR family transcriptional regulator n=1 Tax=Streptosporangium carneum TaxID=47481 RepID=A0A9W6I0U7_9ACTN|nr:TetR/AcrR family transcriptional regulator [Streptosporangium carneum]GLK09366.1 TetR family transcriptional regulator [Streptosporangium carneum]
MARGRAGDPDHAVELLWREDDAEPRPGLSLDRIVRTGVELADSEGLAGLSMRKVAERLGFTTMSLYRHVPGREQLIDLMCDTVAGERTAAEAAPDGSAADGSATEGDGWRARLEACAREGWELRRRHPWLAEVRGGRHVPGPNIVACYERMLGAVADTGLAPAEVIAVAGLVGRFVDSEALLLVEAAEAERRSGVSEEEWWGSRDTLFERLYDYPTLTRLWEGGGFDQPEDPFEFGLARLLDGVELLIRQRYESSDETGVCVVCGTPVDRPAAGRPRAYCSSSCRQRAYRRRRTGRD